MTEERALYEAVWKPKLDREVAEGAYRGGNLRIDLALRVLPGGRKLLDVGCGSGTLGAVLLEGGRYAEVHGLEVSEEAVKRARSRGVEAVSLNLNRDPFPYPDGSFEAVTCLAVIEHVLDPRALVREMARVLAPGGVLLLDTPNLRYAKHLWTLGVLGRFPTTAGDPEDLRLAYDGGHLHYFTYRDIRGILGEAGFEDVRFLPLLPAALARGVRGRIARALSRVPGGGEFLSAEIFGVAHRSHTHGGSS